MDPPSTNESKDHGTTGQPTMANPDLSAQSLFSLPNWVAVVTGGGTGLGLMAARALAQNGCRVYITGRRAAVLASAAASHGSSGNSNNNNKGGSIVALPCDVTSKESLLAAAATVRAAEGYVNLLINNAGVASKNYGAEGAAAGSAQAVADAMLGGQEVADWAGVFGVNVAGVYFASAAFLPLLVAARDGHGFPEPGSIIVVSSLSGLTRTSQRGQFAYNASKAAAISLTQQLAVELKRPGLEVRVNTVAPGYFPSEMSDLGDEAQGKAHFRERWGIPLGRAGNVRDYAQAVLALAVNQYVTGSTLLVDGGWLSEHP